MTTDENTALANQHPGLIRLSPCNPGQNKFSDVGIRRVLQ